MPVEPTAFLSNLISINRSPTVAVFHHPIAFPLIEYASPHHSRTGAPISVSAMPLQRVRQRPRTVPPSPVSPAGRSSAGPVVAGAPRRFWRSG